MSDSKGCVWIAISHHGFGHLGQMAPVLIRLKLARPSLRIVIQTGHPRALLERFLQFEFELVSIAADQPLVMRNAISLDVAATLKVLTDYHARANEEISRLAKLMQAQQVSLVVSNIGYFPLVAARQSCVPSIAFCSLNWADILSAYVSTAPQLQTHVLAIGRWYSSADVFLTPRPFMAMPSIRNVMPVGPVARGGTKHDLSSIAGRASHMRFGLVSLGGIDYPLPYESWPRVQGWEWIVPEIASQRAGLVALRDIPLPYTDVLNSVDVLITKPGYGNIAEAGCGRIPVACLPRADWPETRPLLEWLQAQVPVLMIDEAALHSGDCLQTIANWQESLNATQGPHPAEGVHEVVEYLLARITA